MKKNKNKTKKFSRLSALFFASILLFQIINPVVANAIDVSAKREEIYNKLKEAYDAIVNETTKDTSQAVELYKTELNTYYTALPTTDLSSHYSNTSVLQGIINGDYFVETGGGSTPGSTITTTYTDGENVVFYVYSTQQPQIYVTSEYDDIDYTVEKLDRLPQGAISGYPLKNYYKVTIPRNAVKTVKQGETVLATTTINTEFTLDCYTNVKTGISAVALADTISAQQTQGKNYYCYYDSCNMSYARYICRFSYSYNVKFVCGC